jgi:hypothetical protein
MLIQHLAGGYVPCEKERKSPDTLKLVPSWLIDLPVPCVYDTALMQTSEKKKHSTTAIIKKLLSSIL